MERWQRNRLIRQPRISPCSQADCLRPALLWRHYDVGQGGTKQRMSMGSCARSRTTRGGMGNPNSLSGVTHHRSAYRTGDPIKYGLGRHDIAPAFDLNLVVPITKHVINEPAIADRRRLDFSSQAAFRPLNHASNPPETGQWETLTGSPTNRHQQAGAEQ